MGCKKCNYIDINEHCCCAVYSMLVYLPGGAGGARHFFKSYDVMYRGEIVSCLSKNRLAQIT